MACKVIFLGAGASVDAGFPLCNDIFKFLERRQDFNSEEYNRDWNIFLKFRQNHPYKGMNVEEFYTELENLIVKRANNSCEEIKVNDALGRMIDFRFGLMNHLYKDLKGKRKLEYFENMISGCNYVLTVNWDNLCEFILADNDKWHPCDGYGIPIELTRTQNFRRVKVGDEFVKPKPRQETISNTMSEVKILKLHGSMGWRKNNNTGKLYLRHFDFLQYVPKLRPYQVKDKNEPDSGGDDYYSGSVMIFPSYNKKPEKHNELKKIWDYAKSVLDEATEIVFVGYSLPYADKHLIQLLSNLRYRIDSNYVNIKCILGDNDLNDTSDRYFTLFGKHIEIIRRNAGDYFLNNSVF